MRTIETFILRLFIDPDETDVLRGALQFVEKPEIHPFAGEKALIELLHQMAGSCLQGGENQKTDVPNYFGQ